MKYTISIFPFILLILLIISFSSPLLAYGNTYDEKKSHENTYDEKKSHENTYGKKKSHKNTYGKKKISLTKEKLSGSAIRPSLGLENIFLEGSISLIEKKEKRIVIKDQSILVTPKTSFTNNNSYRPMTFQDLKVGSGIRVNVIYEKGEVEAISIHELDQQTKRTQKDENNQEQAAILFD